MKWKNLTFFLLLHLHLFQWHKTMSSSSNPSWGQIVKNKIKTLRGQTQEGGKELNNIVDQPTTCRVLPCSVPTPHSHVVPGWTESVSCSPRITCAAAGLSSGYLHVFAGAWELFFLNVPCWLCWSRMMPPACAARLHCIRLLPFL